MKTTLLIAAVLLAATAVTSAEARSKRPSHRHSADTGSTETYRAASPHLSRPARVVETHDTIRAHAADPTHQYKLPDWARAAFESRGGRR